MRLVVRKCIECLVRIEKLYIQVPVHILDYAKLRFSVLEKLHAVYIFK